MRTLCWQRRPPPRRRGDHFGRAEQRETPKRATLAPSAPRVSAGFSRVSNTAILFIAHGSRDANWRRPLDAIVDDFRGMHAAKLAALAFLEFMTPDVATAARELVAQGATRIRVVSLFLAEGGHIRRDVAALVEAARAAHPGVAFSVSPPLGEIDSIRSAISSWVATQL